MFGLFKKSPPEIAYRDKVWKTRDQALKGLATMALLRVQQGKPALILGQFQADLADFEAFFKEHKVPYSLLQADAATVASATIHLGETSGIEFGWFRQRVSELGATEVMFIGHYPIPSKEHKQLSALQSIGINSFLFGTGLDDPLLAMFLSSNILPLLEKLGMEDEEALEHDYIKSSLKRAFQKLSSKVPFEKPAKSAKEWIEVNAR